MARIKTKPTDAPPQTQAYLRDLAKLVEDNADVIGNLKTNVKAASSGSNAVAAQAAVQQTTIDQTQVQINAPTDLAVSGISSTFLANASISTSCTLAWTPPTLDANDLEAYPAQYEVWAAVPQSYTPWTLIRTNLFTNPLGDTATGITGWTAINAATVSFNSSPPGVAVTTSSGSVDSGVAFAAAIAYPVGANTYTVSMDLTGIVADGWRISVQSSWVAARSDSAYVQVPVGETVTIEHTFTTNGGAKGSIYLLRETATGTGSVIVNNALFEAATESQGFFDGASADSDILDNAWTGTANASTSTQSTRDFANAPDPYRVTSTAEPIVFITNIEANTSLQFMVRAKTQFGIWSDMSDPLTVSIPVPAQITTAPDQPSLASRNGMVTVTWNGQIGGVAAPVSVKDVIVQKLISSSWTNIGTITNGTFADANQSTGTTQSYRLVARDVIGRTSNASTSASITVVGATLGELDTSVATLISNASADASAAITAANGKNRVIYSASAASGTTGYVNGDTWFQRATVSAPITGQWEFVSGAWQAKTLSYQVIASVDLGTATVGFLSGDRITANSISTTQLLIANTMNLAQDPSFEYNTTAAWTLSNGATNGTGSPRTGSRSLSVPVGTTVAEMARQTAAIQVEEDEVYRIGAWVRRNGVSSTMGGISVDVLWGTTEASTTSSTIVATQAAGGAGTYQFVVGEWTVPATAKFMRPRVTRRDTTNVASYQVDDYIVAKKVDGNLIVDGSIDGKTITGALIRTASTGLRVQLDTVGLRTYNASNAVTSTLTADSGGFVLSGTLKTTNSTYSAELSTGSLLFKNGATLVGQVQVSASNTLALGTSGQNLEIGSKGFSLTNVPSPYTTLNTMVSMDIGTLYAYQMATTNLLIAGVGSGSGLVGMSVGYTFDNVNGTARFSNSSTGATISAQGKFTGSTWLQGTLVLGQTVSTSQNANLDVEFPSRPWMRTLTTSDDLNYIDMTGTYICTSASVATLARNYPLAATMGMLEVFVNTNASGATLTQAYQRFTELGTGRVWVRTRNVTNPTTSPWGTGGTGGNGWQALTQPGDTGWVDISGTLLSGFTSTNLVARRNNNIVEIRGTISGSITAGTTVVEVATGLPVEFRPVGPNTWGSAYGSGYSASVTVRAAGTMAINSRTAINNPQIGVLFLID